MNNSQGNKNNKKNGVIITTISHVIIIVLFCLFGFTKEDPKMGITFEWELEGIENAGGKTQEVSEAQKLSNEIQNSSASEAAASAQQDEELATDESNDVSVKTAPTKEPQKKVKEVTLTDSKKDNPKETEQPKKEGPSSELQKLLDATAKKRGEGKPTDEGIGVGPNSGTEGDPNSTGTSPNGGTSGGNGAGEKWVIGKRKPVKIDQKKNNCNETGKVDVYIKIDRQGNVISAVDRGGTTQNSCLIKKAIEQAKAIKYAPSNTFNEGTITIDLGL